jgi:glycosyltransferase involved in cell wall biosynthesis
VGLVHTHDLEAFAYGGLAAWLAGRISVIHTQHGLPVPFGWKQRWKAQALSGVCRRFVGVSDEVAAVGIDAGWFARDRTLTITNGVDVAEFRPDPTVRDRVRQALGIPGDDLVVISVARLAAVKDHMTLVRGFAASAVATNGHLLLVGDGPERERIENEIGRLDRTGRIRMLGARPDVRELLAAADVFALTSRSEGISISLLEAMATGLVPVVTAVGGNSQVVRAGSAPNGILVAPGAIENLAAALQRVAKDDRLRGRLGDAARTTIRDRFSFQAMMDRYLAAYRA